MGQAPLILVVDDEPSHRTIMARCLRAAGYTVHTAADGETALAAVAAGPPDLVLVDLLLPRMSGPALLTALERHHPAVSLVVMSALGADAALPGLPFLAKPFGLDHLLACVHEVVPLAPTQPMDIGAPMRATLPCSRVAMGPGLGGDAGSDRGGAPP